MAITLSTSQAKALGLKLPKASRPKYPVSDKEQLELSFLRSWKFLAPDYPEPVREFIFHPTRLWRVDFAWPNHKLAVEVEGGIYDTGGHSSVTGILRDIEKYNSLAEAGWRVLRYANPHIYENPSAMVQQIIAVLEQ